LPSDGAWGAEETQTDWLIGDVVLPLPPQTINFTPKVTIKKMKRGRGVSLISVGSDQKTLVIQGFFYVKGLTKLQLDENYVAPLEALQGTVVALQTPDGRKAGSYLLETVDTWETQEGTTQRISYRISLTQADEHIVLT